MKADVNGGEQTLASYGITLNEDSTVDQVVTACQHLQAALLDGSETWLRSLPISWTSGNLMVTHAGPDPDEPTEGQDDKVFLWGHGRFLRVKITRNQLAASTTEYLL